MFYALVFSFSFNDHLSVTEKMLCLYILHGSIWYPCSKNSNCSFQLGIYFLFILYFY